MAFTRVQVTTSLPNQSMPFLIFELLSMTETFGLFQIIFLFRHSLFLLFSSHLRKASVALLFQIFLSYLVWSRYSSASSTSSRSAVRFKPTSKFAIRCHFFLFLIIIGQSAPHLALSGRYVWISDELVSLSLG